MSYTVPNNLVSQYNAGQRQADPSKIDENFNYCTNGLDTIDTLVKTAAAEGVNGIAQIATQAIAQAGTDDTNKFLNVLKGKYLVQALVNAVGNLGTSNALTAPVAWANQITGGAYYVPSNAGNTGGPSTDAYHLIVTRYGDSDVAQLAFPAVANSQPSWRVKIGGTWGSWLPFVPGGTQFATSTTASATADKVAALSNYTLSTGSRVLVTFSNTNTVAGALTLNVNGTGAKAIYNERGAISATNVAVFPAGVPIEFVYDGTYWRYVTLPAVASLLSTCTTTGDWTITGCTIGKPLFILMSITANTTAVTTAYTKSGAAGGYPRPDVSGNFYAMGNNGSYATTNVFMCIPTSTTVVLGIIIGSSGNKLEAYQ